MIFSKVETAGHATNGSQRPPADHEVSLRHKKWQRGLVRLAIVASALFILGACDQSNPPATDGRLVETHLTFNGGPRTADAVVHPTTVRLTVLNEAGALIGFDANWVQRAAGEHTAIVVPANERSTRLYLNEGQKLTFIARAYGEDGTLLAYGSSERVTTAGSSMSTAIELQALLGTVSLTPRLPTNYVVAGQVLDLVLSVTPPGRDDLIAPPTHFRAAYSIGNGTARATTERGVRLMVGDRSNGDLMVDAIATGFVADAAVVEVGEVSAHTLVLPFPTEIVTDAEPPTISDLAFDDHQLIFTGVAADNIGLTLVELYDGPVRLATTDREFISAEVPEIYFPGGGTAFQTHLNRLPDGPTFTVVATDHAGHESTLDLSLHPR